MSEREGPPDRATNSVQAGVALVQAAPQAAVERRKTEKKRINGILSGVNSRNETYCDDTLVRRLRPAGGRSGGLPCVEGGRPEIDCQGAGSQGERDPFGDESDTGNRKLFVHYYSAHGYGGGRISR